jgi:hypothetical protein
MNDFEKVTKEEILKQGHLGFFFAPLQISRFVVFKKLTWKERFRVFFFGLVSVSETYSVDKPEERTYEVHFK